MIISGLPPSFQKQRITPGIAAWPGIPLDTYWEYMFTMVNIY
jgi:hypothetical protein